MIALWLLLVPLIGAAIAYAIPSNRHRPWVLPVVGAAHLALTWQALRMDEVQMFERWLEMDRLDRLFLPYISVLFFLCSCYAPFYLVQRIDRSNRTVCACLPLQLSMMTLVVLSHHLGLMWVAIEGSTLATAPSIYFNHNPRSLEATWKYLLLCSVGVAIALLGSFFLAYSAVAAGLEPNLLFDDLLQEAKQLKPEWLETAFLLLFVGYGAKMGLAPMHAWKPDAYGEAPGLIGALLAGGIVNCCFLAIVRCYHICLAADHTVFAQRIMIFMGLFSMGLAALSMPRQRDIKRILAYSSIEHMGILIFGMGIGGAAAIAGSLLHVVHNGLSKGLLFLSAANIHRAYGTQATSQLSGVLTRLPVSGALLLAGFFCITASPPFACFVSEFQILSAALDRQQYLAGGIFGACLLVVFIGMGSSLVNLCFGAPPESSVRSPFHETAGTTLPIIAFFALVLLLGVYNPPMLNEIVTNATQFLVDSPTK